MLTAKQIVEKGIIFLSDESKKKYNIQELSPAQAGVDLHMISCSKIKQDTFGTIYADDMKDSAGKPYKTTIPATEVCPTSTVDGKKFWILEPGQYEIGFAEGCNFDSKSVGKIVHRSSVRRCGGEINSPLWDPGFHTNEMGTFLTVGQRIKIYEGARVAQMLVFSTEEDAEMYNGQYQGTGVLNGKH